MSNQRLDPPREPWKTAQYEEDPFGLGDIDVTKLKIVSKDFLPKPEDLVFKVPATEKITMELEKKTVDFFREKAQSLGASYQRMIRKLLSEYVAQQRHNDKNISS